MTVPATEGSPRPDSASHVLQILDQFDFIDPQKIPSHLRKTAPDHLTININALQPAFIEAKEEYVGDAHGIFVGRDQELTTLTEFLETASKKEGQIAFVSGVAGSGKTSLAREFGRLAQKSNPNLSLTFCYQ